MADTSTDGEVERIAQDIERYLLRHRDAADTSLGIARWWLGRPDVEAVLPGVEAALERLIERGIAIYLVLPDGNRVFAAADRPST